MEVVHYVATGQAGGAMKGKSATHTGRKRRCDRRDRKEMKEVVRE
jgi:hypothetical protein